MNKGKRVDSGEETDLMTGKSDYFKNTKPKQNIVNIWDDGCQFGDISTISKTKNEVNKTILGIIEDVMVNLAKGELQTAEGLVETDRRYNCWLYLIKCCSKYNRLIFSENDDYNNPKQDGWRKK